MGREERHSVLSNAQTTQAINEGIEIRVANRPCSVTDGTLSKVQRPHAECARRALNPGRVLQSAREVSTVSRGEPEFEKRLAAGVDRDAAFRDVSYQNNRRRGPVDPTHRVLVGPSSGPWNRERRQSGMAGCALQPGAVMALVGPLEPMHDDRLHRSAPHPDRGRKFSEQGGRRIEAESETDPRRPDSRPQQERRSLDRTPRRDDGPGPHMHGDGVTIVVEGGLDALDFAALDDEMVRFRIEQEPGPGAVRVREIRHERRLLRIVDAAEEAEVAAVRAAVRVSRDEVVVDAEPIPERLAPATQHVVRRIDDTFLDVHPEAAPHLVDERLEGRRGQPVPSGLLPAYLTVSGRRAYS